MSDSHIYYTLTWSLGKSVHVPKDTLSSESDIYFVTRSDSVALHDYTDLHLHDCTHVHQHIYTSGQEEHVSEHVHVYVICLSYVEHVRIHIGYHN